MGPWVLVEWGFCWEFLTRFLGTANTPLGCDTRVPTKHRICVSHLRLGLVFVLIVEKLISTQHKPALLPILHDAPLLLQPSSLQHRAQPALARRPPGAPALLPHHQAFGAGWNPKTHIVSMKNGMSVVRPAPSWHLVILWSAHGILTPDGMIMLGLCPLGSQGAGAGES